MLPEVWIFLSSMQPLIDLHVPLIFGGVPIVILSRLCRLWILVDFARGT